MDPFSFLAALGTSGVPVFAAVALGLLMALSPCTVATSVAAVIYIAGDITDRWHVFLTGGLYTLGRMAAYIGIASVLVWVGLATRDVALFFQQYGERLIAPVLIPAGLWMLGLIPLSRVTCPDLAARVQAGLQKRGMNAFLLGLIFALSFCPISIVLYFGLLIPLAYRAGDPVFLPAVFAIASTLPVLAVSVILVTSARSLGRTLTMLQDIHGRMQQIAGIVFLAVGIYYIPRFLGF